MSICNPHDIIDWNKPYRIKNNPNKERMEIWQERKLVCYANHCILAGPRPEQLNDSKAYDILQISYNEIYDEVNRNAHMQELKK